MVCVCAYHTFTAKRDQLSDLILTPQINLVQNQGHVPNLHYMRIRDMCMQSVYCVAKVVLAVAMSKDWHKFAVLFR